MKMNHSEEIKTLEETIRGLKERIKILKNEKKGNLPEETWAEGYAKWKAERFGSSDPDNHEYE